MAKDLGRMIISFCPNSVQLHLAQKFREGGTGLRIFLTDCSLIKNNSITFAREYCKYFSPYEEKCQLKVIISEGISKMLNNLKPYKTVKVSYLVSQPIHPFCYLIKFGKPSYLVKRSGFDPSNCRPLSLLTLISKSF